MFHDVISMTWLAVFLSSFLGCSKKDVARRRDYFYLEPNTSECTWTTRYKELYAIIAICMYIYICNHVYTYTYIDMFLLCV